MSLHLQNLPIGSLDRFLTEKDRKRIVNKFLKSCKRKLNLDVVCDVVDKKCKYSNSGSEDEKSSTNSSSSSDDGINKRAILVAQAMKFDPNDTIETHFLYYDTRDRVGGKKGMEKPKHKIRLISVCKANGDETSVFVHAPDIGRIVERVANVSRMFGRFNSPSEKVLIHFKGNHNHVVGQEANALTVAGIHRFLNVSKMHGQDHFRNWILDELIPKMSKIAAFTK